jgi:hypothetical protein
MGLFDYVTVSGPAFVCSEGHDLSGEEFQTKDLGCTMGDAEIGDRIEIHDGGYGDSVDRPLTSTIEIYCSCRKCPALVQAETFNTHATSVEFEIKIADDIVVAVQRTSETTAEQMASGIREPYMHECRGPMSYEDAKKRQRDGKFFPWDPVPVVDDEAKEAQRKWRADLDEWHVKNAARLARRALATTERGEGGK